MTPREIIVVVLQFDLRMLSIYSATVTPDKRQCPFLLLFFLHHMRTVIFASDHSELNSGQVLSPSALHQHHVVLLQVVSLPGDEGDRFFPVGQPHSSTLPVGRVGLLGLSDHSLEHHCLQLGAAERGPHRFGGRFGLPLTVHLVECGHRPGDEGARPGGSMLGGLKK